MLSPKQAPNPIPAIPPHVVKTPHLHGAPTTEETSFVKPGYKCKKRKTIKKTIFQKKNSKRRKKEGNKGRKKKGKEDSKGVHPDTGRKFEFLIRNVKRNRNEIKAQKKIRF